MASHWSQTDGTQCPLSTTVIQKCVGTFPKKSEIVKPLSVQEGHGPAIITDLGANLAAGWYDSACIPPAPSYSVQGITTWTRGILWQWVGSDWRVQQQDCHFEAQEVKASAVLNNDDIQAFYDANGLSANI
jgi:hypothetical protein